MDAKASQQTTLDFLDNLTEVESACLVCYEKGVTKFLPTHIPHFRDIIISAFECPSCGYRNSELFNSTPVADFGVRFELTAKSAKDLTRQLVVSEHCSLSLPEIDFQVDPPGQSGGYLTTVEGLLNRWNEGVQAMIESDQMKEQREKLSVLMKKLGSFTSNDEEFSIVLDDPSGGSYLERFVLNDPLVKENRYKRSKEQHLKLGLAMEQNEPESEALDPSLYTFSDCCSGCGLPCETRMHPIQIPHFREVIIMATVCDHCGYKSSEVKSGGAIQPRGRRIILRLESIEDLSRDILKSESCSLSIPDIALELGTGTLGGRFTTIEGVLAQVRDEIVNKVPFCVGDSADTDKKVKLDRLVSSIDAIISGERFCTIIIDDPLGNSYVQSLYAPDPDPQITEEEYDRSFDQNEEFGLNDINVDEH